MAYDAFISYRRSDRDTADGVVRFLGAFGLKVFVDRSSRAGTEWEPELREALAAAKVLVVLWSRSAAGSSWVEEEWRHVAPQCCVVAIKLDGAPLPVELSRRTAIEGFDVGSRLLQRSVELMQRQKLSPSQAQAQLVQELAEDGIVLEPERRDALGIFLGFLSGLAGSFATNVSGGERAPPGDSTAPASASVSPPPPARWARLASMLGAATIAGGAFGYLAADRTQLGPPACPETIEGSGPAASTASSAPPSNCPAAEPCPEKPCEVCTPVKSSTTTARCPPIPTGPTPREQALAEDLKIREQELKQCIAERMKCERTANAQNEKLVTAQKELDACKQKLPRTFAVDAKALSVGGAASTPIQVNRK